MNKIEKGESCKLLRPSFLLKGVIVQHHSIVEVNSRNPDGTYTVLYTDKEGYQHELTEIQPEELEKLE